MNGILFDCYLQIHKSIDELYEKVDKSILPKEYGGEIPLVEMIEKLKMHLQQKRDQVLALDEMYIEIDDKSPIVSEMKEELGIGMEGSFKKLQVD